MRNRRSGRRLNGPRSRSNPRPHRSPRSARPRPAAPARTARHVRAMRSGRRNLQPAGCLRTPSGRPRNRPEAQARIRQANRPGAAAELYATPSEIRIAVAITLSAGVSHSALLRSSDLLGIFPERARAIDGLARTSPFLAAVRQFLVAQIDLDRPGLGVDRDSIAIPDQSDRPANRGLRSDMADAEAARRAREAPIGDERNLRAHALPRDRSGRRP